MRDNASSEGESGKGSEDLSHQCLFCIFPDSLNQQRTTPELTSNSRRSQG